MGVAAPAGRLVIDANKLLGRVTSVTAGTASDRVTVRFVASLQSSDVLTCTGLDVEPGATTEKPFKVKGYYLHLGSLVLSTDTLCLAQVTRLDGQYMDEGYVYAKGICRLGAADLSAYATREYVDGRLAEIQSLEEVSF